MVDMCVLSSRFMLSKRNDQGNLDVNHTAAKPNLADPDLHLHPHNLMAPTESTFFLAQVSQNQDLAAGPLT